MNYKQLKEKLTATEKSNRYLKECNKNKEILFNGSMRLLTFANMQVDLLVWVIEEIKITSDDGVTVGVAGNALERHELDKKIHDKTLFPNLNILISNHKSQDE